MLRKTSATSTRKVSSTSSLPEMRSKSKKISSCKKRKKEKDPSDVDSLMDVKETAEMKKIIAIDEKIRLLKLELKSLVGNKKNDGVKGTKNELENNKRKDSEVNTVKKGKDSKVKSVNNFKPSCSSTPAKLSDLPKPIVKLKKYSLPNKEELNSEKNTKSKPESSNSQSLPQQKIEQLLFKSLVLKSKNSDNNVYNSGDETTSKRSTRAECKKRKLQKCSKSANGQESGRMTRSREKNSLQKGKKRRSNSKSCEVDEDVIILDSPSIIEVEKPKKPPPVCVDLDVDDYDWDVPFDFNPIPNLSLENKEVFDEELDKKCVELMESVSYDEIGKGQPKGTWECPVCFEKSNGQEIVATQCGHVFCKKCIETYFSKLSKNCPSCRADLKDKPLITLFNF